MPTIHQHETMHDSAPNGETSARLELKGPRAVSFADRPSLVLRNLGNRHAQLHALIQVETLPGQCPTHTALDFLLGPPGEEGGTRPSFQLALQKQVLQESAVFPSLALPTTCPTQHSTAVGTLLIRSSTKSQM